MDQPEQRQPQDMTTSELRGALRAASYLIALHPPARLAQALVDFAFGVRAELQSRYQPPEHLC